VPPEENENEKNEKREERESMRVCVIERNQRDGNP
jgi:hypothetical protein